jgi:hypothetical protein
MDKTEIIVWCAYAGFVVLGLIIFISISCYVRSKLHTCEEERAIIRKYNEQISKQHAYGKKPVPNSNTTVQPKETFSLFNMLS